MCSESSGKNPPSSTRATWPYVALMLSAKLARRARPPLGVCQPQGAAFPFTSTVERMISLSGSRMLDLDVVAAAPASSIHATTASAAPASVFRASDFMQSLRRNGRVGWEDEPPEVYEPPEPSVKIDAPFPGRKPQVLQSFDEFRGRG